MKKRILSLLLAVTLCLAGSISVYADETTVITWGDEDSQSESQTAEESKAGGVTMTRPFLALGADLSESQLATVAQLMNLTGQDLSQYDIVYVTNEMEHEYLDQYLSSSVIGTKALSCVLVTQAQEGHGIQVVTKNINYCTEGMYKNALLTAGIEDADIMVVGPTSISGTAALIGAIKAYENMTGETVTAKELDTALDELVTTGELADALGDSEQVADIIAIIKAEIAQRELNSEEDIEKLVREVAQEYKVNLTEEEIAKIVELMLKVKDLGLDYDTLLDQAGDLYSKFGDRFTLDDLNSLANSDYTEVTKELAGNFFKDVFDKVVTFFKGFLK